MHYDSTFVAGDTIIIMEYHNPDKGATHSALWKKGDYNSFMTYNSTLDIHHDYALCFFSIYMRNLCERWDLVQIRKEESDYPPQKPSYVIATRLIAGDYPNTKNIVPRIVNYTLEVNSQDLIKAIDRANILSVDRENVVDLSMSEEGIEISAKSSQVGSVVGRIEMYRYEGVPLTVSFNSEFVVAAVKSLSTEDVTFSFVGEMKPFVIKNSADESIVQVVTPVRTY